MTKRKSGFTLMEIMIVIIVIAVLASVAGPMIGNITDQGRASATKSKMSNLKSALIQYQGDVGRFPYIGGSTNIGCSTAFDQNTLMCDNDEDYNVLVCNSNDNVKMPNYGRKWKGPYMDSDPSDFMFDSWGNRIMYVRHKKNLYLVSLGANGVTDTFYGSGASYDYDKAFKDQTNADRDEDNDDIVISVTRFKKDAGQGKAMP